MTGAAVVAAALPAAVLIAVAGAGVVCGLDAAAVVVEVVGGLGMVEFEVVAGAGDGVVGVDVGVAVTVPGTVEGTVGNAEIAPFAGGTAGVDGAAMLRADDVGAATAAGAVVGFAVDAGTGAAEFAVCAATGATLAGPCAVGVATTFAFGATAGGCVVWLCAGDAGAGDAGAIIVVGIVTAGFEVDADAGGAIG